MLIDTTKLNFITIVCAYLWRGLQSFVAFDGAGRIPSTLLLCTFCLNLFYSRNEGVMRHPSCWWLFWCVYVLINAFVKGAPDFFPLVMMSIGKCYICMHLVAWEYEKDASRTLRFLTVMILVYAFSGLLTMAEGEGGNEGRLLSDYGNYLPIAMVPLSLLVCLQLLRHSISWKKACCIIVLTVGVVVVSATRKAFLALLIVFFFFFVSKVNLKSIKSVFYLILFVCSFFLLQKILDNTVLGGRFEAAADISSVYASNWFLELVGDRASFYVIGWDVFRHNILTGIGLLNYPKVTGASLVIHSEYMVQLAECGVIGTLFYLLFMAGMILPLLRRLFHRDADREYDLLLLGGMLAVLVMSLTAWVYDNLSVFIIYGIVLAYNNSRANLNNKLIR